MVKNYVLDTNVLVHDPYSIYNFDDNNVIIPIVCIEELDNLKRRDGVVGFQARAAARELSKLRQKFGSLRKGIKLESGGTIRIDLSRVDFGDMPAGIDVGKNDSKIIAITRKIADDDGKKGLRTILVSKDLYMQIKGDAVGIEVQDYQSDKVDIEQMYSGYANASLTSAQIKAVDG